MNINIQTTVANNRTPLSMIGSNLGKQFFQIEVRDCWPNFEAEKNAIQMENNQKLILNRSPRRYCIKAKDITSVAIGTDVTGDPVVFINPNNDGSADVTLPVTNDMVSYGVVTAEAVKEALKGGPSTKAFVDPKKLESYLNEVNNKELSYIRALKEALNRMEQSIISTINDNTKKANDYMDQINKPANPSGNTPAGVQINVHE
ncbi:hypothetical protein [uncultured phage cr130_1]|uniref:Uncharacterized protein n=1 Tax=uncultured phage cr130_1 TaxID=2772092 RepID=A0A7M1RU80_9CAUD|nr:hypothetical protein KNV59_gp11 [uncultured phage cr130_1]QOR57694.1 hypothetical protein [uncultured phage cr130_1]